MSSAIRKLFEDATYVSDIPQIPPRAKRLPASARGRINKAISNLTFNTYFRKIPMGNIMEICGENGVIVLQEDSTEWEGMLLGDDSHAVFLLGDMASGQKADWGGIIYDPYKAALYMSWYKMSSGKYEIVAYLT